MDPKAPNVMAVWARAQPRKIVFAPIVMADPARMEPSKMLSAPRVAVEPRAHKTFSALAPFFRMK